MRTKQRDLSNLCRYATERSPQPMVAVEGLTHIVRYVNPAFCRLAGKDREELVGHPFADAVPEGERNGCMALLDRVYLMGETETLADQDHTSCLLTGTCWSYTAWAILDEEEHPTGVMFQVMDTTEAALSHRREEQAKQEMREINQALLIASIREQELAERAITAEQQLLQLQKMESIGRLAGGIAHDFNNLLTAILGFTELAEETLQPDDAVQNFLHSIHQAADRAASLTSQLLAFARKQIIQPRVVNLNALILDMNQMLHRLLGEHIELAILPAADVGKVKVDLGQFGQVLMNLVTNARDAMPDGGKLTIATANVTLDEDYARLHGEITPGDYVMLMVSDTGTGLAEEIKTHLFEPFFTTKRQGKGTGLGLATCYGIVKQSGGHIWVTSESEKGTTFHIYLPRVEEATNAIELRESPPLPLGTETIFLVEDEPMVRQIGVRLLRRQGYTVFEAENGIEALRLIDAYPEEIHLVVTDVMMPQMGGKELAERLRVTHPAIRVLYTSGYTDEAINLHGVLDPGLAFLQKPFTPAALAHKVREILEKNDHESQP
jgi:PAS domain S-box-containing protein